MPIKQRLIQSIICILFTLNIAAANASVYVHYVFSGVDGKILNNIETRLNLDDDSNLQVDNLQQAIIDAKTNIIKAVQPYGYFKATVQANLQQQDNSNVINFNIHLGDPIRIATLNINVVGPGKDDPKFTKYLTNFPIHVGDVFNTDTYEAFKERIFQTATNNGYIKTAFNNKVIIDLKNYRALVTIVVQTNNKYYFGKITYNNIPYSSKFMDRFVTIKTGEIFSSKKLISFQQNLSSSVYFSNVVATPDFANIDDYHVPVNLTVQLPKSQKYTVGIGYGSFTGPRVTAGVSLRRTTDTGQHLDAQIQYSPVLSSLTANYYIPGKDPLNDQWVIGATGQYFAPKRGLSQSLNLSGGYNTIRGNWTNSLSLNYLIEHYIVYDDSGKRSNSNISDYSMGKFLYPEFTTTYTNADNLLNPSKGYSLTLKLQGATENIASTTSFAQGELSGKYIFSPASFNKVILRGDVGYTVVHDKNDLPLTMLFFAGGVNSVRGYGDSALGPGKYLTVGSVEYRNKLYGDLDGAVFYDIGGASDHFGSDLNSGAGVGLVYNSVIGPIKLYGAEALDGTSHKGIYLSVGPEL